MAQTFRADNTIRKWEISSRFTMARRHTHKLPDNRALALGRVRSIMRRHVNDKELLQKMDAIIKDQLNRNMIELVKHPSQHQGSVHYLPHQPVIKSDHATTKVRLVYDASSKTRKGDLSLNDCLGKGPLLLNDLTGILLRSRLYAGLLLGDIEKAFLQIEIKEEDRDALRFFWPANILDPDTPYVVYRFTRVAFGLTSSPAHLAAVIQYHLKTKHADSQLAQEVNKNLYVDNVLLGLEKKISSGYPQRLKILFQDAGMNLREFNSNKREVLKNVPPEDLAKETEVTKILGIKWNMKDDTYMLRLPTFSTV